MKILFGGTFDPVHNGHIQLALHIANEYQHPVDLLPLNGLANYKPLPQAKLAERLAMLELAVKPYSGQLTIDYSESQLNQYSPTYRSLQSLRQIYGPELPFYFIIGGDSLISLDSWDNWQQLFNLTNFIVAMRPAYSLSAMSDQLRALVAPRICDLPDRHQAAGQIVLTKFKPIAVSSSQIRQKCANQQAIDDLLSPEVASYIQTHNLYKRNLNA